MRTRSLPPLLAFALLLFPLTACGKKTDTDDTGDQMQNSASSTEPAKIEHGSGSGNQDSQGIGGGKGGGEKHQ